MVIYALTFRSSPTSGGKTTYSFVPSPTPALVDFYHFIVYLSSTRLKVLSRHDLVCLDFSIPSTVSGKKKVLHGQWPEVWWLERQKSAGKEGAVGW